MPLFDPDMENHPLSGHYGFSAVPVDSLGAAEYTLAVVAADVSSSVHSFRKEIEACVQQTVRALRQSPRADNLMLRTLAFSDKLTEVHGFKPLMDCAPSHYKGTIRCGGCTALYDAAHNALESVLAYGQSLVDADYDCNALVVVITDGGDNSSSFDAAAVKKLLDRARQAEALESVVSILVGVNVTEPHLAQYLADFQRDAGFSGYVEIGDADASSLARLAGFISRSISAQSQALGTGGGSQSLSF